MKNQDISFSADSSFSFSSCKNSVDPLNFSFMDEVFVPVNLNENYNYCPICQAKINDSCPSTHPEDFHKYSLYKDINKRIEEKIEIIEKNLKDIGELKWNYHSFSNHYIFKPSTPVNFNHRNALFKARKLLCDYLNII